MQVFLDESGDLGWSFDKEYRKGGSSRYLTQAFMFLPPEYRKKPKNLMRSLYRQFEWQSEKKASSATLNQKILFCQKAIKLLQAVKDIKIDVITVRKKNVSRHIRVDSKKLYNYMAGLVIPDYVSNIDMLEFIPDERTIKVKSGNSLVDYLQTKLWLELRYKTKVVNHPGRSHQQYNLQFVDWIANCVRINFEEGITAPYNIISPYINHRPLFFNDF